METKPFNLQAPEQIAKDYMGNKQKIAAAAQAGTLDPTAAVLAGMFIDRMRSAQVQEQAPARTVAQDVLSPPMQMGLGAPPPGMAPMGAPPAMGMPSPPVNMPPPSGGMADLPVQGQVFPDANFAGGGIVAFAAGDPVVADPAAPVVPEDPYTPENLYGLSANPLVNASSFDQLYKPQTARRDQVVAYYEGLMSPEAQEKARKQDLYTTLAQIGFGMAGTNSPSFLQAAGQAANAAIPGAIQARKERKAEQRQGLAALASVEDATNAEQRARADYAQRSADRAIQIKEGRWSAKEEQDFRIKMQDDAQEHDARMTNLQIAAARRSGRGNGDGGRGGNTVNGVPVPNFGNDASGRRMEQIYIAKMSTTPPPGMRWDPNVVAVEVQQIVANDGFLPTSHRHYAGTPGVPVSEYVRDRRGRGGSGRDDIVSITPLPPVVIPATPSAAARAPNSRETAYNERLRGAS